VVPNAGPRNQRVNVGLQALSDESFEVIQAGCLPHTSGSELQFLKQMKARSSDFDRPDPDLGCGWIVGDALGTKSGRSKSMTRINVHQGYPGAPSNFAQAKPIPDAAPVATATLTLRLVPHSCRLPTCTKKWTYSHKSMIYEILTSS
jgi:hypothetical protein